MGRHSFTPREQQVIGLLFAGGSNQSIADDMRLDLRTVKSYINSIAIKLGIPVHAYCTRVRICYVIAHQRNLLGDFSNWPRP